jgi:hypothetical protein
MLQTNSTYGIIYIILGSVVSIALFLTAVSMILTLNRKGNE